MRLRVDWRRLRFVCVAQIEIASVERRGERSAGQRRNRRREIDRAHRRADHARRERRRGNDHRHVQRRFVKQQAVRQLAVLAERFAVIADERDDGVAAIDRGEQPGHLRIDVRDFAVVRLRIRRRRRVRRMRIVEMHPREEWPRFRLPQPRQRAVDHVGAAAFGVEGAAAVGHVAHDLVVVALEAAIESEAMIEDERGDEGACPVVVRREVRRQRLPRGGKDADAVVAHPVMQRQQAGH